MLRSQLGVGPSQGVSVPRPLLPLAAVPLGQLASMLAMSFVVASTLRSDGVVADLRRESGYAGPTLPRPVLHRLDQGTFAGRTTRNWQVQS